MKAELEFQFRGGLFLIDVVRSRGNVRMEGYPVEDISINQLVHVKNIALHGLLDAHWLSWPAATVVVEETGAHYEAALSCPPRSANAVGVWHHAKGQEFVVARQSVRATVGPEGAITLKARLTEQKSDPDVMREIREIEALSNVGGGFRIALSFRLYEKVGTYKEERLRECWNDILVLEETRATNFEVIGRLKQAAADLFDFALIGRNPEIDGFVFVFIGKRLEGSEEASNIRDAFDFLEFLRGE